MMYIELFVLIKFISQLPQRILIKILIPRFEQYYMYRYIINLYTLYTADDVWNPLKLYNIIILILIVKETGFTCKKVIINYKIFRI